ncbi:MAG: DNA mismatch repair endonuclease MutL [Clostridia bacterium]|nr:DNA mismatch repair endonuclease MutL [Clostridia bacterium]
MAKINQLPFEIANLIAAGEVVDRPASVVKELLENAVDAGADAVTAEIKNGGITLIRVADNGCGMSREDLPVCLKRHATSKIRAAEDLERIGTLGFRGEALAAIAAVTDLTVITKTKESEQGYVLTASCGEIRDISEIGCGDGTTVAVENLFHNVPARRKFLKKDFTEAQAVAALAEKVALSHPEIAFKLISDGAVKFSTVGDGNLLHTLYALKGRDFAGRLLEARGELDGVRITGYVGRPDNARNNRNEQNVFINGRYVHSKTVTAAVERAYTSYMAPEKFPVYALFLDLPRDKVDVNVHPAKLEVKFSDEKLIFEAVYYAVRGALEHSAQRPELTLSDEKTTHKSARTFAVPEKAPQLGMAMPPILRKSKTDSPAEGSGMAGTLTPKESIAILRANREAEEKAGEPYGKATMILGADLPHTAGILHRLAEKPSEVTEAPEKTAEPAAKQKPQDAETEKGIGEKKAARAEITEVMADTEAVQAEPAVPDYRIAGILFHCYIVVELPEDKALLIDQHAAHERLLFEELKQAYEEDGRRGSQELILPLRIAMSPEEIGAAKEQKKALEDVGFSFVITEDYVLLTAIPHACAVSDAESPFAELCRDICEGRGTPDITDAMWREKMLYRIACKAAIKGGRAYDESHIDWLVKKVLSNPEVTVCPH